MAIAKKTAHIRLTLFNAALSLLGRDAEGREGQKKILPLFTETGLVLFVCVFFYH